MTKDGSGKTSTKARWPLGFRIRRRVAQLVWYVYVIAALVLAAGALVIALPISEHGTVAHALIRAAEVADLGIFTRHDGILTFHGTDAETKNALANWGLGAVVWIVVGQLVVKLITPRTWAEGHL